MAGDPPCCLRRSHLRPYWRSAGAEAVTARRRSRRPLPQAEETAQVTIPAQSVRVQGIGPQSVTRTVSTPALSEVAGQSFDLPVSVDDCTGIAGFNLTLTYDKAVLVCDGIADGNVISGSPTLATNVNNSAGSAAVAIASTTGATFR